MKKVVLSTLLATLALGMIAPTALAVDKTTDGTIKFVPDTDDDIILPNTDPAIVVTPGTGMETGVVESGLSFTVPGFDFGTVKMKMIDDTVNPLAQELAEKNNPAKKYNLAPMVIVRDGRGLTPGTGEWSMNVSAGEFKAGTNVLTGAALKFVTPRAFNSMRVAPGQEVKAGALLPNFTFTQGSVNISQGAKTIMSSTQGAAVGQTTYMLDSEGKYDVTGQQTPGQSVTEIPAGERVKGVDLDIPGTATKTKDVTYKAEIVWTMANTAANVD